MSDEAYTPEEVAKILKISKYTVYELVKRGELKAYRIGKKVRVEAEDLELFIQSKKEAAAVDSPAPAYAMRSDHATQVLRLAGSHDFLVEHLVQYLSRHTPELSLQATYIGSLEGLMMLHRGLTDLAAVHLLDPASGDYNIPFIERIFIGEPIRVIRLAVRNQGFIVAKGNPKNILSWEDLQREDISFVNRQKGSGTRFLLDTHLHRLSINSSDIKGYDREEWNHFSTAACVARGSADAALGIETAARKMGLWFVPLSQERFDLIMKTTPQNENALRKFSEIIFSEAFLSSLHELEGYDFTPFGEVVYEQK